MKEWFKRPGACVQHGIGAGDILAYADFFFVADEQLRYDEKAFDERVRAAGTGRTVGEVQGSPEPRAEPFEPAAGWEAVVHEFVAAQRSGIGQIIHAVHSQR